MIKQHASSNRNFASQVPFEVTEKLEILLGDHAVVAEHLRQLHYETTRLRRSNPPTDGWGDLQIKVVRLRQEMEHFKQTFVADENLLLINDENNRWLA